MSSEVPEATARNASRLIALGIAALVLGLIAYSTWVRYRFLTASPFPMGIDGYFYPIQLRSLLERGVLYYPSSPLALYAMVPLAAITDPITGARLGAALGGALIAWPAYAVGARLGGHRAAGIVAAAIATTSAGSFYLSVEFVKNGIGLVVGLTVIVAAMRAMDRPTRRSIALAGAMLVAAFLTHKMAAAIAVLLLAPTGLVWLHKRGLLRHITRRRLLLAGGVLAMMLLALGVLFPERFISIADLHLLTDLFSSHAEWSMPAMALRPSHQRAYLLTLEHEALLGGLAAVAAIAALLFASGKLPSNVRALGFTVAGLGLALALPWLDVSTADGLGFRMRLIAYLPWALCTAIVVGAGLRALSSLPVRAAAAITTIVVIASLVFAVTRERNRREGVVFTDEHMVSAVSAANAYLGKSYVIVTDRHIGFMTQYYGETDAHLVAEPFPAKTTWRLLTGNFISRNAGLRDVIRQAQSTPGVQPPIGVHPRHPMGVVIMPEATWQWILPRLPDQSRARLTAWFPQTATATP